MNQPEEIYWDNNGNVSLLFNNKRYDYKFPSIGFYFNIKRLHSYPISNGFITLKVIKKSIFNHIKTFLED